MIHAQFHGKKVLDRRSLPGLDLLDEKADGLAAHGFEREQTVVRMLRPRSSIIGSVPSKPMMLMSSGTRQPAARSAYQA